MGTGVDIPDNEVQVDIPDSEVQVELSAKSAAATLENPITAPLSKATGIGPAPGILGRLRAGQVPGLDEMQAGYESVGNKSGAAFPPPPSIMGKVGQTAGMLLKNPAAGALAGVVSPELESPIPSTARAGRKFEDVMSAAKNVPVNVESAGSKAMRAQELVERGGRPVNVITKFMRRVTDPEKGPLTYAEARDFYSNARLSFGELLSNPNKRQMLRQVTLFKQALGDAIEHAAAEAGKLDEYLDAMQEYKSAMRLKRFGIGAGAFALGKAATKIPVVGQAVKGAVKGSLGQ